MRSKKRVRRRASVVGRHELRPILMRLPPSPADSPEMQFAVDWFNSLNLDQQQWVREKVGR